MHRVVQSSASTGLGAVVVWFAAMKEDISSDAVTLSPGSRDTCYTQVKICGLTTVQDAVAACDFGANALGLVFYPPSSRYVSVEQAAEIINALPPFVTVVGLFLNEEQYVIDNVLEKLPLSMLQFHGTESPAFCRSFERPYIKSVAMKSVADVQSYMAQYIDARGFLLDSNKSGGAGGSGELFDWSLVPGEFSSSLVLAGGLDCDNVAEAVFKVRPTAVDVSSGVESGKGIKDHVLMNKFIHSVRAADSAIAKSDAGD